MKARAVVAAAATVAVCAPAWAGSHTWDIVEVFSNADGTIQYIEMQECCGFTGEIFVGGLSVSSTATGNSFTFPANLTMTTGNEHLLLATAGFAALPGAPTPDYTIVDGFFDNSGDTIDYHVYDTLTFGAVPTDGCTSLHRSGASTVPGTNTPEPFHGAPATVWAEPSDINGDLTVNVLDLIDLLLCFGQAAVPGCEAEDVNGDGVVNVLDLIALLLDFGTSCP